MSQEINLTMTGYRADEVLPDESGEYVCLKAYSNGDSELWTFHYSAKHRAWNAYDHQTEDVVQVNKINRVTHWFRLPEAPEQKGDGNRD